MERRANSQATGKRTRRKAGIPSLGLSQRKNSPVQASTLKDSIDEIDAARREALEDGTVEPAESSFALAKSLVPQLHDILPGRYDAFPEDSGGVTLTAPSARTGFAVTIECDPDGSVACLLVSPGRMRKAVYSDAADLPDGFFREALQALSA